MSEAAVKCSYSRVKELLPEALEEARRSLSETGTRSLLEGVELLCMMGRGAEPVLVCGIL
jgi:hypothetical protein